MAKGELPFRYLGISLHSKKLGSSYCGLLVDKMTTRIKGWVVRWLSYGGRLELIKSVLFGVRNFWAQLFYLPKKVVRRVNYVCRNFLWSGRVVVA